ncbi:MAG TPA: polyprenyl synthetase family protein [Nanoarchaeota archaeon]|nr:polyprenyl synthetase family protein [Nanoarchaeota archaeon]HIH63160.1 polyprenyl synthetase family protein [Nanoarchaeota archaeon]HIJ09223.1 polyprenyl synthetase family protein [Nanoarchaeota archaeon]
MKNELKKLLEQNIEIVDQEIEKLLPKKLNKKWLNHALGEPLWAYHEKSCTNAISKPSWNLLSRGGKRWRPLLMKLSHDVVGGRRDINSFFIIPELIHNGTLIIDDIEDSSDNRRGKPCIHKIYGEDIAINAGNALYYLPLLLIIRNNSLNYKIKSQIYEIINEEMIKISFGQGMDIYWHKKNSEDVTEEHYLQMCAYKTGTLARIAAKLGAILGSGNPDQVNYLGKFAESIGVGFQIQDDILNITNNDWGKDFGEDITEGKMTLMVIKTLKEASIEDKNRLLEILKLKTKDLNLINEAINILKKYDSLEYAKRKAKSLVYNAWCELNLVIKDNRAKKRLKMFADYLIEREI